MSSITTPHASRLVSNERLHCLEQELGITRFQKPLWDRFIETMERVSDGMRAGDSGNGRWPVEVRPSLLNLLRSRQRHLTVERHALCDLIGATDDLYGTLTLAQQRRADLLLRPLGARLLQEATGDVS